jgi:glutathione synthase
MKLGILVNDIQTEKAVYTTIRLALTATNKGHEPWFIGVGDLAYDPDDYIRARATKVRNKKYKSLEIYLRDLINPKYHINKRISVDDLDALLLRNDPSSEPSNRSWARNIGINFGRIAVKHGVIVLNDPNGLANASDKMYFQQFPEELRPKTLITRDRIEIKNFAKEHKKIVLKPLLGSGGKNVFLVNESDISNINQMIDSVSRDGYVVAQEYLPLAEEGDVRLFLLNGSPLKHRGKYAAFRRVRSSDDIRSNLHAGGTSIKVDIDEKILKIAEMVRPKLVQDGMFLVGLDIIDDKILEVNVFTPGGLGTAKKHEGVSFTHAVINAIERKVKYMTYYKRKFNNTELAVL